MDIPKWLQDTVDAGELSPTNRRDPRPIVAPTANAVEHQKRNSRKQKRSTNSSLIEPQRAHQHDAHDRRRPAATDTDHQGAKSGSSSSHSDRLSDDAESHQSEDNPYQRRKRRKTRPDRYDEKPAKTANRDKSKRNNDSRRKEGRRSRAKRKIASETMLVKDYKAKNVSAARLTLPSKSNIGLFKKGRASSPFRARGVPDLAFSEMKFLQKRRESTEDEPPKRSDWAKRKRDRNRAAEEEMSTYFAPKKPVLTERDPNIASKESKQPKSAKDRHGDRADKIEPIIEAPIAPTVEPPERLFLGFGSSGPRLQPHPRSRSASYYTWSESARRPTALPATYPHCKTIGVGELNISPLRPNALAWDPSKPTDKVVVHQTSLDTQKHLPKSQARETWLARKDQRDQAGHQDPRLRGPNQPDAQSIRRSRPVSCSENAPSRTLTGRPHLQSHKVYRTLNLQTETGDRAPPVAEALEHTERQPSRCSLQETVQETTSQRESSPLAELLRKCEQSATIVQQPTLMNYRQLETPNVHSEAVGRFQYTQGYTEAYADNRAMRHSSRGQVPNLCPELRGFDQVIGGEDDPDRYRETLIGANADFWQEERRLETELDGIEPDGLSHSYEYGAVLDAIDDNAERPTEDDASAQEASDLLVSVHSARDQHVFGDWYEDVQGREQVPAGFWRPHRLN